MRVAILGGGIAGVSLAAELAPHVEVHLFEAEAALGYHASGRSAAVFEENYGNAVVRVLNAASRGVFDALDVLSPRGLLLVATDDEVGAFEADIGIMGLTELPLAAAHERVPILSQSICRAAFHEDALDIDTDRLLQHFARTARASGATFRMSGRATARPFGDGWRVEAGGDALDVDIVVNAAGAWADEVAGAAGLAPLGLTPYRRSMARLPAPGGHDARDWPVLFGPGESWYAKPDAGGWIVSPADQDPSPPMDAWADDMVLAEGLARYEAHVRVPVTRVETSWAGLRTFAPDRTLVIGPDPRASGFCWLAGQGGYGFQTSPAAARLAADLILGRSPSVDAATLAALLPDRLVAG